MLQAHYNSYKQSLQSTSLPNFLEFAKTTWGRFAEVQAVYKRLMNDIKYGDPVAYCYNITEHRKLFINLFEHMYVEYINDNNLFDYVHQNWLWLRYGESSIDLELTTGEVIHIIPNYDYVNDFASVENINKNVVFDAVEMQRFFDGIWSESVIALKKRADGAVLVGRDSKDSTPKFKSLKFFNNGWYVDDWLLDLNLSRLLGNTQKVNASR